jgi:hypothetical protein
MYSACAVIFYQSFYLNKTNVYTFRAVDVGMSQADDMTDAVSKQAMESDTQKASQSSQQPQQQRIFIPGLPEHLAVAAAPAGKRVQKKRRKKKVGTVFRKLFFPDLRNLSSIYGSICYQGK